MSEYPVLYPDLVTAKCAYCSDKVTHRADGWVETDGVVGAAFQWLCDRHARELIEWDGEFPIHGFIGFEQVVRVVP